MKDAKSKPSKVPFNGNEIKDGKITNDPNIAKSITNAIAKIGDASGETLGGQGRKTHRRRTTTNPHKTHRTKSRRRLRRRTKQTK